MSELDFVPRRVIFHRNLTELCQVWTLHLGQLFFSQKFDKTESSLDFQGRREGSNMKGTWQGQESICRPVSKW